MFSLLAFHGPALCHLQGWFYLWGCQHQLPSLLLVPASLAVAPPVSRVWQPTLSVTVGQASSGAHMASSWVVLAFAGPVCLGGVIPQSSSPYPIIQHPSLPQRGEVGPWLLWLSGPGRRQPPFAVVYGRETWWGQQIPCCRLTRSSQAS